MEVPARALECPHCHHSNAPGVSCCGSCGARFGSDDNATAISLPVECPRCHHSNAAGVSRCASCRAWLGSDEATVANTATDFHWSRATRAESPAAYSALSLEVGTVLAD